MNTLLVIHAATTWTLVGLIWTVQLIHYPLLSEVGRDNFSSYHVRHIWRTTILAAPLTVIEFVTAVLLAIKGARDPWLLASFAPMIFAWFSTWFVQVPLHLRLARGFDAALH